MRTSFILRIYRDTMSNPVLSYFNEITISGITIISKPNKFDEPIMHKGNQNKFGYSIELSKKFNKVSGSHTSFNLSFKGAYIDIIVKNFPRYPAFGQCKYAARNCLNGFGYTNSMNNGFPTHLRYRKFEFLPYICNSRDEV